MNKQLRSYHGYTAWLTADTASALGATLRTLALSLAGYTVSGSTVAAGWLGTSTMIAQQVTGIFGGTFVDRHNRRTLVIVNAIVGLTAWGTASILMIRGTLSFSILLVIAVFVSIVNGFLGSATDAILRSIIDIHAYPKARSVNEGRDAVVTVIGGPLSGFLYSVKQWLPFLVSAVMYAITGVAATRIPQSAGHPNTNALDNVNTNTQTANREQHLHTSFIHDFIEGWTWTLRQRLLVVIMAVAALINFGVNGIQYAIQLHLVSIGTNTTFIGVISSGIAVTALIGSFLAGILNDKVPVGTAICTSFMFICLVTLPMTLTDNYWIILVFNSLIELPFPLINAMLLGYAYAKAPQNMQGRIDVTLSVPAQLLSCFCSAAAGGLLSVFGFQGSILVFLAVLLVATVLVIFYKPIRTIPRTDRWI